MTIKIKSKIKDVMHQKKISIQEVREKTGLPHIAILNASSDKIEFSGLNILSKIASALGVNIKDLFDEVNLTKKKQGPKRSVTCDTNISSVTEKLIKYITKLSTTDKDKLLRTFNTINKSPTRKSSTVNITTDLIELIMDMSLGERCNLLGDFISYSGDTKRRFGRKEFFRPVPFTVKGKLYHGNSRNISLGGVFIEVSDSMKNFTVGDTIKMNIEHPETAQHFNLNGKIVRIARGGIGVEFDENI